MSRPNLFLLNNLQKNKNGESSAIGFGTTLYQLAPYFEGALSNLATLKIHQIKLLGRFDMSKITEN
mgnify:FL=1